MKKKFYRTISILLLLSFTFSASANVSITYFSDVKPSDWYYSAVDYTVANSLFNGTSKTFFSPDIPMTRGMFVTVLGHISEISDFHGRTQSTPFSDVTQADYFFPYVIWASDNNIVTGVGNNMFNPHGEISREQLATILFRYAEKCGYDITYFTENHNVFSDIDNISDYAITAIKWAVTHSIINGADGKLNPQDNASRAQTAQIFLNFSKLDLAEPTEFESPAIPDELIEFVEPVESAEPVETIKPIEPAIQAIDWETYNPKYTRPTGKSATDADGGYYDYDLANEIMDQINVLRVENGRNVLLYNPKIQQWASIRAKEQVISFSHTRPDGSACLTVGQGLCAENLQRADDYTESWKENIQGYSKDVILSWYNSEGHRLSMLNPVAKLGAISCYVKGNNVYTAHLFSMKSLYYMDYLIQ